MGMAVVHAQPGYISTFAGAYPEGDGGPAKDAVLNRPGSLAIDRLGQLYIVETGRIRRIDANGNASTFAGTGVPGFSGDGGPASVAQINTDGTCGILIDRSGSIIFADRANRRIRKITPDGAIQTIAGRGLAAHNGDGGPATNADIINPTSLAFDSEENLYIASAVLGSGGRVRRIDTNGVITTIAGNGQAGFSGDGGPAVEASFGEELYVAVDGEDNLWIVDSENQRIRMVRKDRTV